MANAREVEIAKRLLASRVLPDDTLREAFALQEQLHEQGQDVSLDRILYHLKALPVGSLSVLDAPSPLESQPIEDYRLTHVLGQGGSSIVYAGVYEPNDSPIAAKILDPIQALRPDFLARFRQEAETLIELEHENIVLGYHVGTTPDPSTGGLWHFFTMDHVDGLTVLEVIDRRGFLSNEESLSITLQTARALAYLHDSGYLHRDIKPGNIMIEESGRARLIDLGLSRRLSADAGKHSEDDEGEEMTVGTMEYVSPEQARGRADLDPRSDIYSLGVSLYHMVMGDIPFHGETDYEVMAKQVLSALDTQKVKVRRISPEVQYFITRMMLKDREDRFGTVTDVIRDIEGYLPGEYVPVEFGDEPPPSVQPVQPVQNGDSKKSGSSKPSIAPVRRSSSEREARRRDSGKRRGQGRGRRGSSRRRR